MSRSSNEPNFKAPPSEFRSFTPRPRKGLAWLAFSSLILLGLIGWPLLTEWVWTSQPGRAASPQKQQEAQSAAPASEDLDQTNPASLAIEEETAELAETASTEIEMLFISSSKSGFTHLNLYNPAARETTPINHGNWEDIHPSLSPDGQTLAFASNRSGHWDIFSFSLKTGELNQLSDDLPYDASPSWSPDSAWLSYEHYKNQNLDIYIRPFDASVEPVRITTQVGVDFAPAWSPSEQRLAFVSDRSGKNQIWLVDLSVSGEERFTQLAPGGKQNYPSWSPDGQQLAWSELQDGLWRIFLLDLTDPNAQPHLIGAGEQPTWSSDGLRLFAIVRNPNETYLTAYTLDGELALALEPLQGNVDGLAAFTSFNVENLAGTLFVSQFDEDETDWLLQPIFDNAQRQELKSLTNVAAPYPQLNALAIPYFEALRTRTIQALGWDLLSNLANAYIPLTVPSTPDRQRDWLYTGRAFSLHEGLLEADWLHVVKEEFAGDSYWRIFIKPAQQDGSYGRPMTQLSWNFDARYNGSNADYQAGGRLSENVPTGYWLDFTALAADFAWERLPALSNWRSYFRGSMYQDFILRQKLNWDEAMLQLYPPELLSGQ